MILTKKIWKIGLVALFPGGVAAANDGADFANNLLSDLAPLLALFGERVAQQFMSEAMGWPDVVLFAMAPLGIMTGLVSAIRVGGPAWLKAIIGRAKESRAMAEVELMSSTSHDVCEMWNGQAIVRIMGSPPILQLIYLGGEGGERRLCTLEEGGHNKLLQVKKGEKKMTQGKDVEKGPVAAPNISLNIHDHRTRRERRIWAVFGIIVQICVLAYAGMINYYSPWLQNTEDQQTPGYAFPFMALGTILLVLGMFICAFVVERSSKEEAWEAKSRKKVRALWLQKGQIVNDQLFDSYAIFAPHEYKSILTSRPVDRSPSHRWSPLDSCTTVAPHGQRSIFTSRTASSLFLGYFRSNQRHSGGGKSSTIPSPMSSESRTESFERERDPHSTLVSRRKRGSTTSGRQSREPPMYDLKTSLSQVSTVSVPDQMHPPSHFLENLVIIGTLASAGGFTAQFIGLRGMDWSVTIAQLVATIIMVAVRAWVRRGLADKPITYKIPAGHEMDWLATRVDNIEMVWNDSRGNDCGEFWTKEGWGWSIISGTGIRGGGLQSSCPSNNMSRAHKVMQERERLGKLSKWTTQASILAISLARSIDIVMNTLFASTEIGPIITWPLMVPGRNGAPEEKIYFTIRRNDKNNNLWESTATELEAILSLWLFAVRKEELRATCYGSNVVQGHDWLRYGDVGVQKQSVRLLGRNDTESARRDLAWWIEGGATDLLEVSTNGTVGGDTERLTVENHRVVGVDRATYPFGGKQQGTITFKKRRLVVDDFNKGASKRISENKNRPELLAVVSKLPLEKVIAQDLFSSFMFAVAETTSMGRVEGKTIVHEIANNPNDPPTSSFKLINSTLSTMAKEVEAAGLGTLEEAYMSIIPPLSLKNKLPHADAVIHFTRENTRQYLEIGDWMKVGKEYLWLFRICMTYGSQSRMAIKATAFLTEVLRSVNITMELWKKQMRRFEQLRDLRSELLAELKTADPEVMFGLARLYKKQDRLEGYDLMPQNWPPVKEDGMNSSCDFPEYLGYTPLHQVALEGSSWKVESSNKPVNGRDILEWTPLHYAAISDGDWERTWSDLFSKETDLGVKDIIGWTPLHYAAARGKKSAVCKLLEEGADLGSRGLDGMTALHCAAMHGHIDVVRHLLKAGAHVKVLDSSRRTPLHWAASYGHQEVAEILLEKEAYLLEAREDHNRTPLHLAAMSGNDGLVSILLAKKAQTEAYDKDHRTPFHLAQRLGMKKVLEVFGARDAEKESPEGGVQATPVESAAEAGKEVAELPLDGGEGDQTGGQSQRTSLHLAAISGEEEAVRLLLDQNVDKNARDTLLERTPLHLAAIEGRKDVVRLLLEHGADKDATDGFSRTPLHLAVESGMKEVAEMLLQWGADKEAIDKFGKTPSYLAVEFGMKEILQLLLDRGIDKKARNTDGNTLLHWAAELGKKELVALLVGEIDKDARDKYGQTPLHRAAGAGNKEVVQLLLDRQTDREARDSSGKTPLHLAVESGKREVVEYLLHQGANKEARNKKKQTPLDLATTLKNEQLVQLLQKRTGH